MKSVILSASLLFAFLTGYAQSRSSEICRIGFTYDISQSNNWGTHKPVITGVTPYSSAELTGLKQGDVVEEIDGVQTTEISPEEINELLNPAGKNDVILTISNLATESKQVMVKKDCKKVNSITEDQLATAFAMYSLETTGDRTFTCPFKTVVTTDSVNFGKFRTFVFAPIDENNRKLETAINKCIEKELTKKGMTVNAEEPDILIQTFYYFDKNPNFKGANKITVDKEQTYRYNCAQSKMEAFPFLNNSAAEAEAEYLLQFGFRMIDQVIIPGRVLWECEANELMEDSYKLDDYARIHVPLMLMQYPYVKYGRNVVFNVSQRTYNYTGISYDIDRLELVTGVAPHSPAYEAGVRTNDVIEEINNNSMKYSAEEFTSGYKSFITKTMQYRDPNTQFTDAGGFKRCMYWSTFSYPKVAEALHSSRYMGAFSYLFYYAPYINPEGNNACTFVVKRGKNKTEIVVRPTVRKEVSVEVR